MSNGTIQSYTHNDGKVGVLLHLTFEPDIGNQLKELLNSTIIIAMQIAATNEKEFTGSDNQVNYLLSQKFVKKPEITVQGYVKELSHKYNTKINIKRFTRYEV